MSLAHELCTLIDALRDAARAGQPAALATLTVTRGATFRRAGARMRGPRLPRKLKRNGSRFRSRRTAIASIAFRGATLPSATTPPPSVTRTKRSISEPTMLRSLSSNISKVSPSPSRSPTDVDYWIGTSKRRPTTMEIRLTANGKTVTATLIDNATSRDVRSLLPLTLTLEDYAATEKIAYLPRKLSTEGVPPGFDPSVGDVTYYAPWGNLAIFHKDAPYAEGLIQLGRIDSGLEVLSVPGPVRVTIEAVDQR